MTKPDPPAPLKPRRSTFVWAIGLCFVAVGVLLILLLGQQALKNVVGSLNSIGPAAPNSPMLIAALVSYALLLAVPFMPGVEVGVALLLLRGAEVAPYVYLATVTGLMLAFVIGRCVPLGLLERGLKRLRLKRAAALVAGMQTTPPDDRLTQYRSLLPAWLAPIAVDYRYVALAILINVPGTFAIGGGGGILLATGFSRLFRGWLVLLTVMIATLPIPFTVWIMGTHVLGPS